MKLLFIKVVLTIALLGTLSTFTAQPANADTPDCVSHGEYDNMEVGLTPTQVYVRFDIFGTYLGDTDTGKFKRGYDACWTNERRVVVWYSYDTNDSVYWAMRDV